MQKKFNGFYIAVILGLFILLAVIPVMAADKSAHASFRELNSLEDFFSQGHYSPEEIPPFVVNVVDKVKICHATNSPTNPYDNGKKEVSVDSIFRRNGHDSHPGDIIPDFYYEDENGVVQYYAGKNWDAVGYAIWLNGCNIPQPDPTNTPVPIPTNTPVPIPTNTPVPVPTGNPTNTPVPVNTNTPVPVNTNTPVPNNTKIPPPPIRNTPTCIPCPYFGEYSYLDTPTIVKELTPFIAEGENVCVVGAIKGSNDYTCYSKAYVIWITTYDMQLEGIESVLNADGTYTTAFIEYDYQNNNLFADCEERYTGDLDGVMMGLGYLEPGQTVQYDNWYPRMIPFVK